MRTIQMRTIQVTLAGTVLALGTATASLAQSLQAQPKPGTRKTVQVDLGPRIVQQGRFTSKYHDYRLDTYEWNQVATRSVVETVNRNVWVPDPAPVDVIAVYVNLVEQLSADGGAGGRTVSASKGQAVFYFAADEATADMTPAATRSVVEYVDIHRGSRRDGWTQRVKKNVVETVGGYPCGGPTGSPLVQTMNPCGPYQHSYRVRHTREVRRGRHERTQTYYTTTTYYSTSLQPYGTLELNGPFSNLSVPHFDAYDDLIANSGDNASHHHDSGNSLTIDASSLGGYTMGASLGSQDAANYNVVGSLNTTDTSWAYLDPLILDIGHLGRPDLLAGDTVGMVTGRRPVKAALRPFDLDASGRADWEWLGKRSGLLVWDPHHTGKITSGKQLIGTFTWGKYWRDGYQVLSYLDRNHTGTLTGAELDNLGVWIDANSDGVAEPGEVKSLAALGITSLSTRPQGTIEGAAFNPHGFVQNTSSGPRPFATWDWISYGAAKPDLGGSTYVWVSTGSQRRSGGFLNLRESGGHLQGFTMPTVGAIAAGAPGIVWPVDGSLTSAGGYRHVTWTTPSPVGTSTRTEVSFADGGQHLYGTTTVQAPNKTWSYNWQAQLIKGAPLR